MDAIGTLTSYILDKQIKVYYNNIVKTGSRIIFQV